MALPDIQIDDRTFDQLLAVLRKQIPTDYTDHNPSDPVIALLELFCWLGEIALYRMNRVPTEHQQKFLNLLIDPPVPVTVPVTFTVTFAAAPTQAMVIPAGTRVATDFRNGRRFVFETIETATVALPDPPSLTQTVMVTAREYLAVTDEILGQTDGSPQQTLQLSPVLSAFGLAPDAPAPLLVDYVHRSVVYDPNPQIRLFRGFINGIGGAVSAAAGFRAVQFTGTPQDAHFLVTFAPPDLTLTRADGVAETVAVAPAPIVAGETERLDFPGFGAQIVLSDAFDKSTAIGLGANAALISGGTGVIDVTSLALVATMGSVAGITSVNLTIDPSTPSTAQVTLADGFSGTFDGSTGGVKRLVLRDAHANTVTLVFTVTTPFDGNETGATLQVGLLANLVVFGGEHWEAQHSLLTERSRVDPLHPGVPRHVRVDPVARTMQFGDGVFGARAPAGARAVCSRYQLLQGPAALIEAHEIQHLLTPLATLGAGDTITVSNEDDASGGNHFFSPAERLAAGLESFRTPYRLVTAADFERVLLDDFNAYQVLAGRPERIARAVAVMNRRPPLNNGVEAPGHVTVMVLRGELTAAQQVLWNDTAIPVVAKEALLALGPLDPLERRLLSFVEQRRLITTHVHVVAPRLLGIDIDVRLVIDPYRNSAEMEQLVREALLKFVNVFTGGFDARGWPPGRDVYRSDLFRLLEGLRGVDHVDVLTLAPAGSGGDVDIGAHALPVIQTLNVTALRS